ncbi:hypothetical protein [Anaerotruncus colihominis]|nr:hypothetical protein [Anaerotruncus colihominis]
MAFDNLYMKLIEKICGALSIRRRDHVNPDISDLVLLHPATPS